MGDYFDAIAALLGAADAETKWCDDVPSQPTVDCCLVKDGDLSHAGRLTRFHVSEPGGRPGYRRTTSVLHRVEDQYGFSPAYVLPVMRDLGAAWSVHLQQLDQDGNWGTGSGDPPADSRHLAARLSVLGELALASERGDLGPVPIGPVDGTLYKGGRVPPLDPHGVVAAVSALVDDPSLPPRAVLDLLGPPAMPTGGTVSGDLDARYAGATVWLNLGCRLVRERTAIGPAVAITGTPLGVALGELDRALSMRTHSDTLAGVASGLVRTVNDETSMSTGPRIVIVAAPGADLDELERWVHGTRPATVEAECRLPAPAFTL